MFVVACSGFFCEKCQLLLGTGLVLPGAATIVFDLVQCNTLVVETMNQ
jgi:hypothetical protein